MNATPKPPKQPDANDLARCHKLSTDPWSATVQMSTPKPEPGAKDATEEPDAGAKGATPEPEPGEGSQTPMPEEPWLELVPFSRPVVPTFPVEVLPSWVRRFVDAVATETETAPDLAVSVVLSVLATACARRIQVEQRPGFRQPVNLWMLALLTSGGRKSRVYQLATAVLRSWEEAKFKDMRPMLAARASARRTLEIRLRAAEHTAAKARTSEDRAGAEDKAQDLAKDLALTEVLHTPVLSVSEGTPERLEELLCEQGGRIALLSDEGGMLGLLGGRYSKGEPNLASLLGAHDGSDVKIARKRRDDGTGGDRFQEHALVTFGLSVQPETFLTAMRAQSAFFDTGFAWRFLFAVVPSNLGSRTHDKPSAPREVLEEYGSNVKELLNLHEPEELDFPLIRPTAEAQAALRDWEVDLEPHLSDSGDLAGLKSFGSKLASRLCRIAALFHAAEHRDAPAAQPLTLETMQRAISLAPYYLAHVQALAFDLNANQATKLARRALAWITHEHLATFTRRDLYRAILSHGTIAEIERPLAELRGRGFVRQAGADFEVNPAAFGEG